MISHEEGWVFIIEYDISRLQYTSYLSKKTSYGRMAMTSNGKFVVVAEGAEAPEYARFADDDLHIYSEMFKNVYINEPTWRKL
jgi:predicted component of type VI protein secretion system